MNKRQSILWQQEYLRKLDRDSRRHVNCLRFGKNESLKHVYKKMATFYFYRMKGVVNYDVITEVLSEDRTHKADLLILMEPKPLIVEIVNTETPESIEEKQRYWEGLGFDFIARKVG